MIPKIIHFCWFGEKEIPDEYRKYIHSWKIYCPDYKIICWSEKNYDIHKNKYMEEAYKQKKWGFVPDYARLDIIYRYGGFYLDTDVEMLKSLDGLRNNKVFFGLESKNFVALGLGFGAEKGNPLIKQLMEHYENLDFKVREDGMVLSDASPVIQTAKLKSIYQTSFSKDKLYRFGDLTIYPTEYLCPENTVTGNVEITNNTYLWHHYSGSWLTKRQKVVGKIRQKLNKYLPKALAKMYGDQIERLIIRKTKN